MGSCIRRWLYVFGLAVVSAGCTASGGELDGLTFGGSGALPGAEDSDTAQDTDDLPQLSAGDDSAGSTGDADPTGDDPTSQGTTGDDPGDSDSDPTADPPDPTDPTDPTGGTGGPMGDCTPGETESCYGGAAGTEGVGQCQAGTRTCQGDETWGACSGAVEPTTEVCGNGLDEDCNGTADDGCTTATACDPMAPSGGCGGDEHCYPTAGGDTLCLGPTGAGTQYDSCTSDDECAPDHVCIDTGEGTTYCMQWCTGSLDCPLLLDLCNPLTPSVFAGATEHGVCYDGLG